VRYRRCTSAYPELAAIWPDIHRSDQTRNGVLATNLFVSQSDWVWSPRSGRHGRRGWSTRCAANDLLIRLTGTYHFIGAGAVSRDAARVRNPSTPARTPHVTNSTQSTKSISL
jgi:hypothetical protein